MKDNFNRHMPLYTPAPYMQTPGNGGNNNFKNTRQSNCKKYNTKGEDQMARTGFCAAAVGSTTAGMSGPLTATGTIPPTATTIPAFAWPELKNSAGWHFFDPTFILPAYDIIYTMQQKENDPRYASRIEQMPPKAYRGFYL